MRILSKIINISDVRGFLLNKTFIRNHRNMAKILNGLELSKKLNTELKNNVKNWISQGNRRPRLACVLVGDDPASATYVSNKEKAATSIGIDCNVIKINNNISQSDLIDKVNELNENSDIDGVLVQLPLPDTIDERAVCNAVSPIKDVDGFHIQNVGKFCLDMDAMLPCTAIGVIEIIKEYNIETFGKNVVVISRSKNVGMPIAMFMHSDGRHESKIGMDATVTICHRYTPKDQLVLHCRNADIIITATGIPKLVTADMVKPGATIIDVGITRVKCAETNQFKLVGDVDYDEVSKIAGAITPVPGGVGPMTVAMLMRNTVKAAKNVAETENN